jgi:ATP-dependent helicase/DNAse subunit B
MFDNFIKRLQQAGEIGASGRMALLLPSPYLLERARSALRQTEIPAWEFPRVLSLDELAANLAGCCKISRVEQELLIDRLVRENSATGLFPYFEQIADFPGFIAALARLFDELKMADVLPEELAGAIEAFEGEIERNAGRDADIAGLFLAYQERLEEYSLMDVGEMYRRALEALGSSENPLPYEQIFMAEFSVLSPLRLQLVERLKRRVPLEIGICFEKNRPGVFRAVEPVYQALVGMGFAAEFHEVVPTGASALEHVRRNVFEDAPHMCEDAAGIALLLCPNRTKELAVVADHVKTVLLQKQYNPQEVAVVLRDPGAYTRLRDEFAERGIPVDMAQSMPLLQCALPRLIFAWLNMLQDEGSRISVTAVLKSPYISDKLGWDADQLESCLLGEVIRGWSDWPVALGRSAPDEMTDALWRQGWNELGQYVREWSGPATWTQWGARLSGLLEWLEVPVVLGRRRSAGILSLAEVRSELTGLAALRDATVQVEQLDALLQQPEEMVGVADFADFLRRSLQELSVSLADRQDTGVQVVTPETASGMKFRAVFVLGLAEGEFPAPPRESWLYSDQERRTLAEAGITLPTSADRAAAADFSFSLAVGMATDQLWLSAVTDSETLPSRYLAEVQRLFTEDAMDTEVYGPHQLVAETVAEARSKWTLLKASVHHVWCQMQDADEWARVYSALRSMLPEYLEQVATLERERMGAYAGQVDPALIAGQRYSASALEQYAACPFAYFVTEVLGLGEWDAAEEGFDALSSGSIWHEVLAGFLGRYRGQKLAQGSAEKYARELVSLLAAAVDRREKDGRVVPDIWWRFEKPRWEQALRSWLNGELERQAQTDRVPHYFEWAFGTALRRGCDGESTEQPLMLGDDEGETVELQGKVDRVDAGGGSYRIVDYKTGKAPARKQVEQGLRLQVPLYMMAVDSLLCRTGERVADGMYLPVGEGAAQLSLPGAKLSKEELFAATQDYVLSYVAGIRSGNFAPQPGATCPAYCPARTFCRRDAESDQEGTEESVDE